MMTRSPFPPESRLPRLYTNSVQAQTRPPTDFENLLADALEAAFRAGADTPEAIAARLNADGVRTPDGEAWTGARFVEVIAMLGR